MKRLLFLLLAIPFGVWLSFSYINPYGGSITLSELVLQLSGARGTFALDLNLNELLDFTLRLVPVLVFQALAGTLMYQYYCTASVYVFSRIERRTAWYRRELGALAVKAFAYHMGRRRSPSAVIPLPDLEPVDADRNACSKPDSHLSGQQRGLCRGRRIPGGVRRPADGCESVRGKPGRVHRSAARKPRDLPCALLAAEPVWRPGLRHIF